MGNLQQIRCPNCGVKLTQRVQRRMNRFWTGLQPTGCEGCGEMIQWHSTLHSKLIVGGILFRTGLALLLFSLVLFLLVDGAIAAFLVCAGTLVTLIGISSTYTKKDKIKVELLKRS